jgi:hypothetical protein
MHAMRCEWGNDEDIERVRQCVAGEVDVVVASDIVYSRPMIEQVCVCVCVCVCDCACVRVCVRACVRACV